MDTYAVAAKEKKCPAKALRKASLTGCKILRCWLFFLFCFGVGVFPKTLLTRIGRGFGAGKRRTADYLY